jgi:transposase-like protein
MPRGVGLRISCGESNARRRWGLTTGEQQRLKALERDLVELRRANEILRKASA